MKKLLLSLIIITSANSLYGMELQNQLYDRADSTIDDYSEFFPMTLPQIYHYLSELLNRDIAYHIFSLQPGSSEIDENISCLDDAARPHKAISLMVYIERILEDFGYCYAFELLNRNLLSREISICDIKDDNNKSVLCNNWDVKEIKLFLQIAGNDAWKLLAAQTNTHWTALHYAAFYGKVEVAKLLLDAADNNTWALLDMRNSYGCTALHEATGCTLSPEARDEVAKLLLNAAGDNIWTFLTRQSNDDWTALHFAARYGRTKITQFLLDTAGDRTQDLIDIRHFLGKTAFDIATPEAQKIMLQYIHKNNQ